MVSLTSLEFTRGTASKMNSIAALLPKISFPPNAPFVNYIDRFDLSLSKTLSFPEAEFNSSTASEDLFPSLRSVRKNPKFPPLTGPEC
ncbi:hypothetical protein TNCV_4820211 [Trichonephila clavipes]|nr:hypothetical protein TNCV_4820211 [Trichonephila clavipes]